MTYLARLFRPIRRAYLSPGHVALIVPRIIVLDPFHLLSAPKE